MRIETASGHTILADDADYPLLGGYSWWACEASNGRFYACAHVPGTGRANRKRIKMHRLLTNPDPGLVVHHKNNDGLDNRRANLQVTTHRVNIRHAHSLGGVHFDKSSGKWRAQVRDETGKQVSLGMYHSEDQARAVVQNWNYRKMLELEATGEADLAEVIDSNLRRVS